MPGLAPISERWVPEALRVSGFRDTSVNFKHLRKTRHTHNPVDDAMGNAEALLHMREKWGLKVESLV